MKYLLALIILFIAVPINAQWASFDLKDIENDKFEEQINPFIKSISLSTTRHQFLIYVVLGNCKFLQPNYRFNMFNLPDFSLF